MLRHEPISRLFKEVEQAFRNQAIARMRAEGIPDLFPGLMPLVLHLGDEDGLTMSELARRCGLENSTLTPLVDELERQGLAARQRDPSDRRVVHIGLTESGRNLQPRLRSIVLKLQDDALAGIPAEDLNTFRRVLEQLLANLG